jgi:hypothetical protein
MVLLASMGRKNSYFHALALPTFSLPHIRNLKREEEKSIL